MSAEEAPVILGRVCSSWRAISFSTPRLWARLQVHIVEPTHTYNCTLALFEAKVAQRLEVAAAWLRRSGACPLSISLDAFPDDMAVSGSCPRNGSPFVNDIHLDAQPSTIEALLSRVAEGDVPLLRSLEITKPPGYPPLLEPPNNGASHWGLSQSGVSRGPSLSSLSIQGYQPNPLHLPLRWAQLTVLSVVDFTPLGGAQVLDILSRCPKLQTSKLPIQDSAEGLLADSRAGCPFLHTFQLRCSHISPEEPETQCLHSRELSGYSDDPLDDGFLATLTSSPAILCPALQELAIPSARNVSDDAVLRFILSRVPVLRLIEINFDRLMQVDILPSLQPFVEAGLQANYMRYPLVDGPTPYGLDFR
ncbi:hypothetical protein C8R47DRAFT_1192058 [Mycena vitilis]|nr:hypothetical protein C8R47DRAFT_1192058 [Mycena vitilis]